MNLSKIQAVIIDDDMLKAADIKKALKFNGIVNILVARNQEEAWKKIYESRDGKERVDLIVTDMHYPLTAGAKADEEAGFKLIERMKNEKINIPVIICSSRNYNTQEILGSVWYNEINNIEFEFKDVLSRMRGDQL